MSPGFKKRNKTLRQPQLESYEFPLSPKCIVVVDCVTLGILTILTCKCTSFLNIKSVGGETGLTKPTWHRSARRLFARSVASERFFGRVDTERPVHRASSPFQCLAVAKSQHTQKLRREPFYYTRRRHICYSVHGSFVDALTQIRGVRCIPRVSAQREEQPSPRRRSRDRSTRMQSTSRSGCRWTSPLTIYSRQIVFILGFSHVLT